MMLCYPINEIFVTLQGEATFTGTPSIFIRFQGCNVGCGWCDTKHTWELLPNDETDMASIMSKINDSRSFAWIAVNDLMSYIDENFTDIGHVVLTGGEPANYDLQPLIEGLEDLGKRVQIETSGTEVLSISENTWVTLSPKINMPGGKKVLEDAVLRANEIKMPIGKEADVGKLQQFLESYSYTPNIPIWLQPLSQNKSALDLCVATALRHGYRVSVQMHKYINIR